MTYYDGKVYYESLQKMLAKHDIKREQWSFYKSKYPHLQTKDLLNLIKNKR